MRAGDVLSSTTGVVFGVFLIALVYHGQRLAMQFDGWAFPVMHFEPMSDVYRARSDRRHPSGLGCFSTHQIKLRTAVPFPYRFYVQTPYSPLIALAVHLANPDNTRATRQSYTNHQKGQKWSTRYCFELPGTVADADEVTVVGYGYHRQWNLPVWQGRPDTETALPVFSLPAARRQGPTGPR